MWSENKGFKGETVTQGFIAIMIVIIIAVAVVIPIVQQVIDDANLTGSLATVVGLLPLLIGVALILIVVRLY